jgi:hypothetical protein
MIVHSHSLIEKEERFFEEYESAKLISSEAGRRPLLSSILNIWGSD